MTRSLLSIAELPDSDLRSLLSRSLHFFSNPAPTHKPLAGKTISLLFYENSTRTRISFENAVRALGGQPQSLAIGASSVQKGETLADTALNLVALGASGFVLRHGVAGAARIVQRTVSCPVINAGDGLHAHPSQALLDASTLLAEWNRDPAVAVPMEGKSVLILGDIRHSRVARSNMELLPRLGAKVYISGPGTLLPSPEELTSFSGIERVDFPDRLLPEVDAVMGLRLQTERQTRGFIPSLAEYRKFWGLTVERTERLKPSTMILHPGPANPGVEIDLQAMHDPRSRILEQVKMGVAARMSILEWCFGGEK